MEINGTYVNPRHATTIGPVKTIPVPPESSFVVKFIGGQSETFKAATAPEATKLRAVLAEAVQQLRY